MLPRNTYAPTFGGYIYIVEGAWTIYATDLYVTKAASGIDFLDTLYIRQTHLPQGENWLLFQQSLSFGVKLLNIDTKGVFLAVFSNYALNPTFAPHFFTKEILKVEAAANEKTVAYWDSIRPVPLTLEEQKGYVKKDSLQTIRQTKTYLDSMDARRNRFAVINLLIGYTYRQSYQKRSFTLSSPINTLQYNTVQGYHATLDAAFRQNYDDYRIRWWRVGANVSYALAEARARVAGSATYHFNRLTNAELSISGGEELAQYNAENPISPTLNTVYTLLAAQNYIKLYDKKFVAASYEQEVWEGGQLRAAISYADRAVAVPHSATTWLTHAGRELADNTPYHSATEPTETLYAPSRALLVSAQLQLKFNQSFIMYPARKITVDDPLYPVVSVQYSGGLGDAPYHKLAGQVTYDLPTGIVGTLSLNATGGYFLQAAPRFYDWQHFSGNQTLFGNPNRYLTNFKLLPYYTQSVGKGYYAEAHLEQDFGSFFFNKIPLLKQLNLTTLAGANVLYTQQTQTPYYEWSVGIGNIGWSVFRIFRIDFAMGRAAGGAWQQGVIIGVKL